MLTGDEDNDILYGGSGNDVMYGGTGNDTYYHGTGDGVDTINDNKNEAGNPGYGGGSADMIWFASITLSNMGFVRSGDNLLLGSYVDLSDGVLSDGVIIENFFLGGNYLVENLKTAEGYVTSLASLV